MRKREKLAREREQKDWIAIVQQMLNRAEMEHQRWYTATDDFCESRGWKPYAERSKAPQLGRLNYAWKAKMELTVALHLVQAGVDDIESAILDSFQPKGEHRTETITRRVLKLPSRSSLPYNVKDFVERELSKLVAQKLITTRYGRGNDKLYLLVTPERQAEWQAEATRRHAEAVKAAEEEKRVDRVRAQLQALGINTHTSYDHDIRISVKDAEKLLVLVGEGLLSFAKTEGQAKAS